MFGGKGWSDTDGGVREGGLGGSLVCHKESVLLFGGNIGEYRASCFVVQLDQVNDGSDGISEFDRHLGIHIGGLSMRVMKPPVIRVLVGENAAHECMH